MYCYIYRIDETLKENLKTFNLNDLKEIGLSSDITFNFFENNIIKGFVDLKGVVNKKIYFEIDIEYRFIFIKADYQKIRNKVLKGLRNCFEDIDGKLEKFVPDVSKEYELITSDKINNLIFLYKGEYVSSGDLINQYIDKELDVNYRLIEADITLNNGISLDYFKLSIKFEDSEEGLVLSYFKEVMS